jgi:hypothetical protein
VANSGSIPAAAAASTLTSEKYPASASNVRAVRLIPAAVNESASSVSMPGSDWDCPDGVGLAEPDDDLRSDRDHHGVGITKGHAEAEA